MISVNDQLFDGRPFRILEVVHQLSREIPPAEVNFAMSGRRVADAPEAPTADMLVPASITVDRGSEFTSKAPEDRAWRRGVKLDFIWPGKPIESRRIGSLNGSAARRAP